MTVSITHAKVSSAPEGEDPTKVRTSDWNDEHVISGLMPTAFVGALIYHNTTQTVNAATVPMNSEVYDTDGFHSTVSNTSRLTVPAGLGGKYGFEFGSNIAALAAGEFLRVLKNGSTPISTNEGGTAADEAGYVTGSGVAELAANDYIELQFTGNRTLGHASAFEAQSHLSLTKLEPAALGIPPGVRVRNSAAQSIAHNTWTSLTFDTEDRDPDGYHSTSSNTSRLTVPAGLSGWYGYAGAAEIQNGTNQVGIRVLRDGATRVGSEDLRDQTSSNPTRVQTSGYIYLEANQYLELQVWQNSGGALNSVNNAEFAPLFAMVRLGGSSTPAVDKAQAGASADTSLSADTIADVTGCSVSLAAGTWLIWGAATFDAGTAGYILVEVTDSSNAVASIGRGVRATASPITLPTPPVLVSPATTTTYKLRAQSGVSSSVLRYGLTSPSNMPGTTLAAIRVVA